MTEVLLLEDEPLAANETKQILMKFRPDYEILEIIGSVKKATTWLQNNNPGLILSDIQLSDGTCFEIFEKIDKEIPIIFITAYNQYAIQAFKEFSIDYLLKPISFERLLQAVHKYLGESISVISESTSEITQVKSEFIFVRSDRKMIKIDFSEINYIESFSDYIKIFIENNDVLLRRI